MIVNNRQTEDIDIIINGVTYNLIAKSSQTIITFSSCIQCEIVHNSKLTDWDNSYFDNILDNVSKMTAIIVDSSYRISEIQDDTVLEITNEVVLYEKDDVCVIGFGVVCRNARIELVDCNSKNVNKLLGARRLLLLLDANDFPIISPIVAITRYMRLKKIASRHNLLHLLSNKTTYYS